MSNAYTSQEYGKKVDGFLKRIFRENSTISQYISPSIFNKSRMYDLAYWAYQIKDANDNRNDFLRWVNSFVNAHRVKIESIGTDIETMLDVRFMSDVVIEKYGYRIGLDFTTSTGIYLKKKESLQSDMLQLLDQLYPPIKGHCIVVINNFDVNRQYTKLEERAIVTKIYNEVPQCETGNIKYINLDTSHIKTQITQINNQSKISAFSKITNGQK